MGLFDSLGSLFSSGSGAAASPGMPWANILGSIISSIRATPNAGATKGDIARAGRINLATSILGGLGQTYGSYLHQQEKDAATQGIFDILAKGGGEKTVEAAGPVMPGMERPMVPTKTPLSEALFAYGKGNPLARDLSMSLGLKSMDSEHQDLWAQKRMDLEQSRYNTEQDWRQKTFGAEQAHRNAMLGLQRDQLNFQKQESEALRPYKQLANERNAYGDDIANELLRSRLAAGGAPAPEVDKGEVGGYTPATPPKATQQQVTDPRLAAFDIVLQRKAAEKAATVGGQAFEKIVGSKEFQELNNSYNQIGIMAASLKDNSKVSDLAFANGWAKAMKPGEGVMADDIKTTLSASGVQAGAIAQFMDVLMGVPGATLDSTTKRKLLEVAGEAVRQREAGYQNIVGAYQGQYGKTFVDPWKRPSVDVLLQQALGNQNPPLGAGGIRMFDPKIPQFTGNGRRVSGWEP
jgi:hypothetical protein